MAKLNTETKSLEEVLRINRETGRSVAAICKELDVSESRFINWCIREGHEYTKVGHSVARHRSHKNKTGRGSYHLEAR